MIGFRGRRRGEPDGDVTALRGRSALRILAIDDQKDVLETIAKMLREAGHEVVATQDAKIGLEKIEADGFEVLITDVLMPGMDGVEVVKTLRRRFPDLWIVAISGGSKKTPANLSLKLTQAFGADRVLFKPFRKAELLAAITPEDAEADES